VATFRRLDIQYQVIRALQSPSKRYKRSKLSLQGARFASSRISSAPHPSTKNKSRAPHLTQNNSCPQQHMSKSHFRNRSRMVLSLIPLLKRLSVIMRQDPCNTTSIFPHTPGGAKRPLAANNRKFLHPIYFGSIPFHPISHKFFNCNLYCTVPYLGNCAQ
jgi:hypothetical protein